MNSVEDAFSSIARSMEIATESEGWYRSELRATVFDSMVRSELLMFFTDFVDETKYAKSISEACIFLRDHLLTTTGRRIYGLSFTLYPDGKFRVDYDYNKPEGYEDTPEIVQIDLSKDLPHSG